jgi:hypothetical protein
MSERILVDTPKGLSVWMELSDEDVKACIRQLPHRWPELVMRRYNDEQLIAIYESDRRTWRYTFEQFSDAMAMAFGALDQLKRRRAQKLLGVRLGEYPGGKELQPDLFKKWDGIAQPGAKPLVDVP